MAGLDKERDAFESVMAEHVAPLMGFARPYVGRLCRADTEALLRDALECAWERRGQFKPAQESLLQWWDGCLKFAALRRPKWATVYSHRIIWVKGADLGRPT